MVERPIQAHRLRLAPGATSVRAARAFVRDHLAGADPDLIEAATLLTSELVTNAVLHTGSAVELRLLVGDVVRVEVHDDSDQLPASRNPDLQSTTGRGLGLIEMLAANCGIDVTPPGKTVWFDLLGGPAPEWARLSAETAAWQTTGFVDTEALPGYEVILLGLPVLLYEVMSEHSEAVLRELALTHVHHVGHSSDILSASELSAADNARRVLWNAFDDWSRSHQDPMTRPTRADISATISAVDAAGLRLLLTAFTAAERLATRQRLLTSTALPEIRALRSWCARDLLAQVDGQAPTPWLPPAETDQDIPLSPIRAGYALNWVNSQPNAVIGGDHTNYIVAASPAVADLLGWTPEELIGRRIAVIIPPDMRENHLAGFTRYQLTGQRRLLGQTVEIFAWHRENRAVPVVLTLEQHDDNHQPFYIAYLYPR